MNGEPSLRVADLEHVDEVRAAHALRDLGLAQEALDELGLFELADVQQLHRRAIAVSSCVQSTLRPSRRDRRCARGGSDLRACRCNAPLLPAPALMAASRFSFASSSCASRVRARRTASFERSIASSVARRAETRLPELHEHRGGDHREHRELRATRGTSCGTKSPRSGITSQRDQQRRDAVLHRHGDREWHRHLRVVAEPEEREAHHDHDRHRREHAEEVDEHHRRQRRGDTEDAEHRLATSARDHARATTPTWRRRRVIACAIAIAMRSLELPRVPELHRRGPTTHRIATTRPKPAARVASSPCMRRDRRLREVPPGACPVPDAPRRGRRRRCRCPARTADGEVRRGRERRRRAPITMTVGGAGRRRRAERAPRATATGALAGGGDGSASGSMRSVASSSLTFASRRHANAKRSALRSATLVRL